MVVMGISRKFAIPPTDPPLRPVMMDCIAAWSMIPTPPITIGSSLSFWIVALHLDLRAAVLAEEDDVALLHLGSEAIAALTEPARSCDQEGGRAV